MVGVHDITKQNSGTRIPVKYYHINPGYDSETLHDDIALLQVERNAGAFFNSLHSFIENFTNEFDAFKYTLCCFITTCLNHCQSTFFSYFTQLTQGAKKSNSVEWISLPQKDGDIKAESDCSVAGWGATKTNGNASNLLLEADVVIMKREQCQKLWGNFKISEKMLCAYGKAGFCQVSFDTVQFIHAPTDDSGQMH